jgi:hypothetical protein
MVCACPVGSANRTGADNYYLIKKGESHDLDCQRV